VKSDLAVGDDGGPGAKGAKAIFIFGFRVEKKWEMGILAKRMNERYGGGVIKGKGKGNAPSFMEDRFLNGESKSIATIPILKICTPPPDMYSMNACIGKDLTGEIAKSQAFLVLRSSYEFNASAVLVVVAKDEDLPLPLLLDPLP